MPAPAHASLVLAAAVAAGCAGTTLPPGFLAAAATGPEDQPVRVAWDHTALVTAAAPIGPGGVPAAVRTAIEAVAPAGELQFLGREWGPAGAGFRVDKRYVDGAVEQFRSALIDEHGALLERSHSVPIAGVPEAILATALAFGRDVRRCEIVSGPEREECWRAAVADGAGRTFVVTIELDGRLRTARRMVTGNLAIPLDR